MNSYIDMERVIRSKTGSDMHISNNLDHEFGPGHTFRHEFEQRESKLLVMRKSQLELFEVGLI